MMVGTVTRVAAAEVTVQLRGSGGYELLAQHWPDGGVLEGDVVAVDELKASPGQHVIVARLAG